MPLPVLLQASPKSSLFNRATTDFVTRFAPGELSGGMGLVEAWVGRRYCASRWRYRCRGSGRSKKRQNKEPQETSLEIIPYLWSSRFVLLGRQLLVLVSRP